MPIKIQLLGRARVYHEERWLEPPLDKRFCLLGYLALAEGWVSRGALAFLFWPDLEEQRARQNLRQLIKRVRPLPFAEGLESEPNRLCWRAESDVSGFKQAAASRNWDVAVALYGGELLATYTAEDSPEFSAWLELERQTLRATHHQAVLQHVAELTRVGRHLEASNLLKPLLEQDELAEDLLQGYLKNLALSGQRELALRSYEQFAGKVKDELGLEPLPKTMQLIEEIRNGEFYSALPASTSAPTSAPSARNLPAHTTPFVGRDLELTDLFNTLGTSDCRLLTITGPGGIGKSRLAIQAARELAASYPNGAAFVPLAPVSYAGLIPTAIAQAFGISFFGHEDVETQLVRFLHNKSLLLVLDNIEHLLPDINLLARLLDACPELKVLVTSRERLHVAGEWLLPVGGMGLPEGDESDWLERYDAVQLFVRCARRLLADFTLEGDNRAATLRICRLLGGVPLGLELAAAWLRLLSCKEIAEELENNLDLLEDSSLPERHRSLRQVFEQSWSRLERTEQAIMRKLAVFRGDFTLDAAQQVAGASTKVLLSLLDKSFLKRNLKGRFELHELVRQYAAEKLSGTPQEGQATRKRHGNYYAVFVGERKRWMKGGERQAEALSEIEAELDNIRASWLWAAETGNEEAFGRLHSLLHFYEIRGQYQEGEDAFRLAANSLREESPTLARLLTAQAMLAGRLYHLDVSQAAAERSTAMLERLGESDSLTVMHLGVLEFLKGNLEGAARFSRRTVDVAEEKGDIWGKAGGLGNLGIIAVMQGHYDEAEALYRETIALGKQIGDRWGLSMGLINMGMLLVKRGKQEEAKRYCQEALTTSKTIGQKPVIVVSLAQLGKLAFAGGDYTQAEALYRESLQIARGLGSKQNCHVALMGLGETGRACKQYELALAYFYEALTSALEGESIPDALDSAVGAAEALLGLKQEELALQLLAFSLHQQGLDVIREPEYDLETKVRAERLKAELEARCSARTVKTAEACGRELDFTEVVKLLSKYATLSDKLAPRIGHPG